MGVNKAFIGAIVGTAAFVLASPALAVDFVSTFDINAGNSANFFITYQNNANIQQASLITADIRSGYSTGTFQDTYRFRVGADGVGSGNLSTSFATSLLGIVITSIVINGQTYTAPSTGSGQTFTLSDIPVTSFFPTGYVNEIVVNGEVTGVNARYQGGITYVANSVPEPASWALMLVGFGGIGAACRAQRRTAKVRFA